MTHFPLLCSSETFLKGLNEKNINQPTPRGQTRVFLLPDGGTAGFEKVIEGKILQGLVLVTTHQEVDHTTEANE